VDATGRTAVLVLGHEAERAFCQLAFLSARAGNSGERINPAQLGEPSKVYVIGVQLSLIFCPIRFRFNYTK